MALPALCLVLGAALFAIAAGITQLRCVDAARAGARVAARGEPAAQVEVAAAAVAPAGARTTVAPGGQQVSVHVVSFVRPPGVLARLGSLRVQGDAVAAVEESLSDASSGASG